MADATKPQMVVEQRRERIAELESELRRLRAEEARYMRLDLDVVNAECKKLKEDGRPIEAAKLYRDRIGCGLSEARDAVGAL